MGDKLSKALEIKLSKAVEIIERLVKGYESGRGPRFRWGESDWTDAVAFLEARNKPVLTETPFGFQWGQASVRRVAAHRGTLCLAVDTPHHAMDIRVTPSGLIRVSGDVMKEEG